MENGEDRGSVDLSKVSLLELLSIQEMVYQRLLAAQAEVTAVHQEIVTRRRAVERSGCKETIPNAEGK